MGNNLDKYNPSMNLTQLPLTYQKTIPTEYLDFVGHMNVMWYTHLFDLATFKFYETFGFGEHYHTQTALGSFALEQHTRYLAEVRAGEAVSIRTRALGRAAKILHFMHFMVEDADGALAATTELVGVHIDMSTRRSSPFPEHIAAGFDEILAAHQKLDWDVPVCGVMGVKK